MSLTTVDPGLLSSNSQYTGLKNRIFNSNFDAWQRASSGTGTGYKAADRWGSDQVATTHSQSTSVPPGIGATLSLQVSSTGTSVAFQRIESLNCRDLAGQQVTVSVWMKSATGTPSITMDVRYPGALNNWASQTIMQSTSIAISTTWTKYTFTFNALSANVVNGLGLFFYVAGSTTFFLSQVQLEKGTVATAYDYLDVTRSYELCQRYFIKITQTCRFDYLIPTQYNGDDFFGVFYTFPVEMRTTPTSTLAGGNNFTSPTLANTSTQCVQMATASNPTGSYYADIGGSYFDAEIY